MTLVPKPKKKATMSRLYDRAKDELTRAGLLNSPIKEDRVSNTVSTCEHDPSKEWDNLVADAVLELIEVFAKQGHSGFSAQTTLTLFTRLTNHETLTPITNDPKEWMDVGDNVWQNTRNCSLFSKDGGTTYYHVDDRNTIITAERI